MTTGARRLVLCHASADPAAAAEQLNRVGGELTWLFLGEEYATRRRWEDALAPLGERQAGGVALQRTADRLRRPFLDLMAELGERHQSLAWWTSRVSERNVHVSPLFLNCCYAALAESVAREHSGVVCVIAADWGVLETLAGRVDPDGTAVLWLARRPGRLRTGARWLQLAGRVASFAWSTIGRRRGSSELGGLRRPAVMIRTWVDEGCFADPDGFRDRYFDGLADWLRARGHEVATIPVLFNLRRSYRDAWRALERSEGEFLAAERLYRPADYLFALRVALTQARMSLGRVALDGRDVTALFDAERRRFAFDPGTVESIASYRLPLRLAQRGLAPDVFIDPFENMIPEKSLILGFRRYLPQTRLVGYQHSTVPPMLLCNFVTAAEAQIAPLPDRVVCSGRLFREVLVQEGLPAGLALVGPALRFGHLWHAGSNESARGQPRTAVLVPLPLGIDPAVELLLQVVDAFEPLTDQEVLIKPHPMLSVSQVLSLARLTRLPDNFAITTESMELSLGRSRAVVSFGSSALYEAVAAGVPVLAVARESGLDLDPLAWHRGLAETCETTTALRDGVWRLRNLGSEQRERYRAQAEQLRDDLGGVDDRTIALFVDGLL